MKRNEKLKAMNTKVSTVWIRLVFLNLELTFAMRKPRKVAASMGMTGRKNVRRIHRGWAHMPGSAMIAYPNITAIDTHRYQGRLLRYM